MSSLSHSPAPLSQHVFETQYNPFRRLAVPFRWNRPFLPLPGHQSHERRQVVLVSLVCLVCLVRLVRQDSREDRTGLMLKPTVSAHQRCSQPMFHQAIDRLL